MNMSEYQRIVKKYTPSEEKLKNALLAFVSGGVIGIVATLIYLVCLNFSINEEQSIAVSIIIIILIASVLTGLSVFDNLVEKFKCGILIPTTGFAHSIVSSTMEYKKDGFITGIGANVFKLAGSVILYGVVSSFSLVILKVITGG